MGKSYTSYQFCTLCTAEIIFPTFNHIFSPKISQPTIEKATYETSSAAENRDKMFSVFDENHWNLLLVNVFGMNRRIFCILNRT